MTKRELLERLQALEKEVADLRAQLEATPHLAPWPSPVGPGQPWDPNRLTWDPYYGPQWQPTIIWSETDTAGNTWPKH